MNKPSLQSCLAAVSAALLAASPAAPALRAQSPAPSSSSPAAPAPSGATATPTTSVFRLELEGEAETPYLVGADGVRRRVCILDPDEYAMLTGQVASVWHALHKTDDGRRKIHGNRVNQIINTNALVKTSVYADGYTFDEPLVRNTRSVKERFASVPPSKRSPVASGVPISRSIRLNKSPALSERHRKFREELERRKNAKPKTVTLEHDANTGKDTLK